VAPWFLLDRCPKALLAGSDELSTPRIIAPPGREFSKLSLDSLFRPDVRELVAVRGQRQPITLAPIDRPSVLGQTDWDNWRARRFKRAAKDVGLGKDLRPYDLRHTAATLFAAAGWDHIEVARQLGHSPEESMRTYQHLIEAAHGKPRRSVDEWISAARGLAPVHSVFTPEGA